MYPGRRIGCVLAYVCGNIDVKGAHQKKGIWRAIAKDVRALGVYSRRSTHCQKWWGDLRRWAWKTAEAQLGMASQQGRSARRTLTP
ncbi:hypothetical protein NDU88_005542 [Pleurodeles waltl]|uniref:Uncharacterized protein n=1 Tax=Pleurodeles waltl TaxID=8319 RepID=A0AAV7UIC8_PLEWA|nr:hypothetical protein NDU88_005542 [Pleurodeles waltl]